MAWQAEKLYLCSESCRFESQVQQTDLIMEPLNKTLNPNSSNNSITQPSQKMYVILDKIIGYINGMYSTSQKSSVQT